MQDVLIEGNKNGNDREEWNEKVQMLKAHIKSLEITVEMHYLGINHGQGMTVFLIPDQKVAYIADLVTPNRVLFSIVPDFNIPEWERSCCSFKRWDTWALNLKWST